MNQEEIKLTVAEYKDTIHKLEVYQTKELDQEKRDRAAEKITEYRNKIIDAAWLGIVLRTEALQALMDDLKNITDKASNAPSLSGAVSDLKDIVTEISDKLGKG